MQDHLVASQALSKGQAKFDTGTSVTKLYTRTARWVAESLLGVEFDEDDHCFGIGFDANARDPPAVADQIDIVERRERPGTATADRKPT